MRSESFLPFEKKVLVGLASCGIDADSVSADCPLGAAVSGGADSVSLLLSLRAIFSGDKLRVITVNHGIRSEEESGGDAEFVRSLCGRLGIFCTVADIPHGKISEVAKKRKKGIEEAARFVRYEEFEKFCCDENLLALCLAHNQNDQLETILMRFLQGSAGEGAGGMARSRGKFIRPLLGIPRSEIEWYLRGKNQPWRSDSTNSDTTFFRNRIRNVLVPILNEQFSGWQKAVLGGAKKAAADEDFFRTALAEFSSGGGFSGSELSCASSRPSVVKLRRTDFFSSHDSIKRRVFFSALNKVGFGGRFPFYLFEEVTSWNDEKSRNLSFENVTVALDSTWLSVSFHDSKSAGSAFLEDGLSFLLRNIGERVEIGETTISVGKDGVLLIHSPGEDISLSVEFPVVVHSAIAGDKIKTADGKCKPLFQIFSEWKIPRNLRGKILVVEELCADADGESQIKAILGSPFGAKNWIVR